MSAGPLPVVWVNGERRSPGGAHVSARDRGLTLADGVFETMRAHGGRVFRLEQHLARLAGALDRLAIPAQPAVGQWVLDALEAAGGGDVGIRLTVTRGVGPAGVAPAAEAQPTAIVVVNALPVFPASLYESGLSAHVASGRRNERAMTAGLKTLGYTDAIAALLEAQRHGADDAVFLDTQGHCAEASSSNLFVCVDGALLTPPVSCGALPGVTRAVVMEIAAAADIACTEGAFGVDGLLRADEAFLTSSLRGVAPLVRVDGRLIGAGRPGPMTRRLREAYRALVARESGA